MRGMSADDRRPRTETVSGQELINGDREETEIIRVTPMQERKIVSWKAQMESV